MADAGRRFSNSQNFAQNRPPNRGKFHSTSPVRPTDYQATNQPRNFHGNQAVLSQKGQIFQDPPPHGFQNESTRPRFSNQGDSRGDRERNYSGNQKYRNFREVNAVERLPDSFNSFGINSVGIPNQAIPNMNLPQVHSNTARPDSCSQVGSNNNSLLSPQSQQFLPNQGQAYMPINNDFRMPPPPFQYNQNIAHVGQMASNFPRGQMPPPMERPPSMIPPYPNAPPFQGDTNIPPIFQGGPVESTPPQTRSQSSFPGPPKFSPNIPSPQFGFAPHFIPGQHPPGLHLPGQPPPSVFPMHTSEDVQLGQAGMSGDKSNPLGKSHAKQQRIEDENWVKGFLKERVQKQEKIPEENIEVTEVKSILQSWLRLSNELRIHRDKLVDCIKCPPEQWQLELEKANKIQAMLQEAEAKLSPTNVAQLQEKLNKKRRKRNWRKRRNAQLKTEKQEAEKQKLDLHKRIDEWREQEIAKQQTKIKEANLKKEAGGVLGDVRKKKSDASKALELMQALRKLREFRKQEAEVKGVYPKPMPHQNREFNKKVSELEALMSKQSELYEAEEKTLTVMMAEEEEEKKRKKQEKKDTQHLAQAAASDTSDPLQAFHSYYTQAEYSLNSLVYIRHGWDIYSVPEGVLSASRIPDDLPGPSEPSSASWATCVSAREAARS